MFVLYALKAIVSSLFKSQWTVCISSMNANCLLCTFCNNWLVFYSSLCVCFNVYISLQVAGVVGRAEMLSALFFLCCFHCYKKSITTTSTLTGTCVLLVYKAVPLDLHIIIQCVCLLCRSCFLASIISHNVFALCFE